MRGRLERVRDRHGDAVAAEKEHAGVVQKRRAEITKLRTRLVEEIEKDARAQEAEEELDRALAQAKREGAEIDAALKELLTSKKRSLDTLNRLRTQGTQLTEFREGKAGAAPPASAPTSRTQTPVGGAGVSHGTQTQAQALVSYAPTPSTADSVAALPTRQITALRMLKRTLRRWRCRVLMECPDLSLPSALAERHSLTTAARTETRLDLRRDAVYPLIFFQNNLA